MMESVKIGLLFLSIAISLLVIIEVIGRKFGLKTEYSRKMAHVVGGFVALYFLPLIGNAYVVLAISIILTLVLFITRYKGILDSVHEVSRETLGSVIFPIPFFLCFVAAQYLENSIYFYLPLLILIISDPAAAIFGSFFGWKKYKVWGSIKSLSGSLSFFIFTLIIVLSLLFIYFDNSLLIRILISLSISLIMTLVEAISGKGSDNVTVPLSAIALIYFFF